MEKLADIEQKKVLLEGQEFINYVIGDKEEVKNYSCSPLEEEKSYENVSEEI